MSGIHISIKYDSMSYIIPNQFNDLRSFSVQQMQENLSKGLKEQQNKIREENSQKQRNPSRKWRSSKPKTTFNFDQSQVLLISRVSNPPSLAESLAESQCNSLSMTQSYRNRQYEQPLYSSSIVKTNVTPLRAERIHKIYRSSSSKKRLEKQNSEISFPFTVKTLENIEE